MLNSRLSGTGDSSQIRKIQRPGEFTGFVEGLNGIINNSSVIIGSGRIAIEALILNRPVIAIGEACTIGLVNQNNLRFALATNFGDMNVKEKNLILRAFIGFT